MNEAIITTVISSVCLLIGTILTVSATANRNRIITDQEQQHIKEELKKLSDRVDLHNNYAVEIPLIKKDIAYIKERIEDNERNR